MDLSKIGRGDDRLIWIQAAIGVYNVTRAWLDENCTLIKFEGDKRHYLFKPEIEEKLKERDAAHIVPKGE